jgi:WD40 repeat protein
VAFSPDGKYLALAGMDGTAVLWEIASESISAEMLHEAPVATLNFSPDSEYLATASYDHTARVWEVDSGEEVARLEHDDILHGVVFSRPDGNYLATASSDGTARVQPWQSEGLMDVACKRLTRNLTEEEWQQYVGGPYHKTCRNLPAPEG